MSFAKAWMTSLCGSLESHKNLIEALQAIATILALLVGGFWTWLLAQQYRETVPKLSITQTASSWFLKDGQVLIRIDAILTNSGKVHIAGVKGDMVISRLLPETEQQAQEYAKGSVWFRCPTKNGKPAKGCIPEQALNLPDTSSSQSFDIQYADDALEPGESLPYYRYLRFDSRVRTIEVSTSIEKPGSAGRDYWIHNSTFDLMPRDFSAPPSRCHNPNKDSCTSPPASRLP